MRVVRDSTILQTLKKLLMFGVFIVVYFCSATVAAEGLIISSFESQDELNMWQVIGESAILTRTIEFSTDGFLGAKLFGIVDLDSNQMPGLNLNLDQTKVPSDWSEYNIFAFDYSYNGSSELELIIVVQDSIGNNMRKVVSISSYSKGTIKVSLDEVILDTIKSVFLYFNATVVNIVLDSVRLEYDPEVVLIPPTKLAVDSVYDGKKVLKLHSFELLDPRWILDGNKIDVSYSDEFVTDGSNSLHISISKYEEGDYEFPGLTFRNSDGLPSDFSSFNILAFDYYNPSTSSIPLRVRIDNNNRKVFDEQIMIPPGKGFKEMQLGELERDNVSRLKIFISRPSEHYTFYIDHLRLEQKDTSGIPLRIGGSVINLVTYDPESGFLFRSHLNADSSYRDGRFTPILFYITSRSDLRFGSRTNYTYNRRISSVIYSLAIRTQCALHPKLKSFDLTLGKYSLKYSPYIATFNTQYARSASGVMFDNLEIAGARLGGFLMFEPDEPYRSLVQGMRVQKSQDIWRYDILNVRYLKSTTLTNDEGKIQQLAPYQIVENDISVQIERRLISSGKLVFLYLNQQVYEQEQINNYVAKKIDLEIPIGRQHFALSYRDFQPGFAPRYRLKTPRTYTEVGRVYTSWNPTDRYAKQKGINLKITNIPLLGYKANCEVDHYLIQDNSLPIRTNILCSLEGEASQHGFILGFERDSNPLHFLELTLSKRLLTNKNFHFFGMTKYTFDQTGNNNDCHFTGSIYEIGFKLNFTNSLLKGLNVNLGIQRLADKRSYSILRGEWRILRNLIELSFAVRNPNISEGNDYWVDDFERVYRRDNYFFLLSRVRF